MARYGHAVLGGTFDRFHVGHVALLSTAFRLGRRVSIGLTTDRFLRQHPKPGRRTIRPYAARCRALAAWLAAHYPRARWRILPLEDPFGGSILPGVGVLVVSAETRAGGRAVNTERVRRGLRPVPLAVVPLVLADDLTPVSSRRIRAGELDPTGRRRARLSVGIGVIPWTDAPAVVAGVRRAFPSVRVRVISLGRVRTTRRAEATARQLAMRAAAGRDLGVGIVRRAAGGWIAVERSATIVLSPRTLPGRSARELSAGIVGLLVPARPQPL